MFGRRLLVVSSCLVVGMTLHGTARAQISSSSSSGGSTTNGGSENITTGIANPSRFLYENGACASCSATNVTDDPPRPLNLNPEGINYTDCEQNLRMDFTLILSGFVAGDEASVQVWAGTVDCTQDTNRVTTAGTLHACWQVAGSYGPVLAGLSQTITKSVYARDVLRYEATPTTSTYTQAYDPTFNYSSQGESACHVQTTDAAVPISIYFIAVGPSANALGTAYQYPVTTDLVAPPPPPITGVLPGDTLITVNWSSPGTDPDIVGFALYSDPKAGGATTGGCSCGNGVGTGASSYTGDGSVSLNEDAESAGRCEEAGPTDAACEGDTCVFDGSSDAQEENALTDGPVESAADTGGPQPPTDGAAPSDGGASDGGATDGATDAGATDAGATDGGATDGGVAGDGGFPVNCNPLNTGGSVDGSASSCSDLIFTGNEFVVGQSTTTTVTEPDGAIEVVEASTTTPVVDFDGGEGVEGGVALAGAGIDPIPPHYKAGEIDSVTATSLTLTGLTNGQYYKVAVASIDGSGNVGPVSLGCAIPEPTNDYWQTYKGDHGGAGSCALGGRDAPVFAVGTAAAAAALRRRRRRK